MTDEVLDVEVVDDATTKALVAQRAELQKVPGAALFLAALQSFLGECEKQVQIGLRGIKSFSVSADGILKRRLDSDEDYKTCVALSIDAAARERAVMEAFDTGTNFFYRFHRTLTAMRTLGATPWTEVKSKLERHAAAWFMEQKRLKAEADALIAQAGQKVKSELEQQAEEKIAMGYIAEGEHLLREARLAATPVSLPDATPKGDGWRATTRWKITVTDVVAVAKAIVEGKVELMHAVKVRSKKETEDRPLLVVDETVVRALIDRMGAPEVMKRLRGVSIVEDVSISGTGRK